MRGKLNMVVALLAAAALLLNGCASKPGTGRQDAGVYYTCPMHHQVHEAVPGYCPICGMKLIKVSSAAGTDTRAPDSALSYLTEPVTETVVGSFKVIQPQMAKSDDTLRVDGYIGFDQRDINRVATRVAGRIEKLYVRYVNQRIRKGQPLMILYSPELVSVQKNLLQALGDNDRRLVRPLKEQLLNLGMQASEIQKLIKSWRPLADITLYSPYTGISRPAAAGTADLNGMIPETGRGNAAGDGSSPEALDLTEGMYLSKGQTVVSIVDTDHAWAILHVFTSDMDHVHSGDPVRLYSDADAHEIVDGSVDLIPPYRDAGEKTTSVRVYLSRLPADWKINTLIHAQIGISSPDEGMYVPLSAVNRLGMQDVVWVQDKNHRHVFHARKVETGIETTDSIQITGGLGLGDKIAENAAYMVDHDSFIQ